jgi:hypothetical protein
VIRVLKGWTVGEQRIDLLPKPGAILVRVDGAPVLAVPEHVSAEWTLPLARRTAKFRRLPYLDVATSELWIDGAQIPPSSESFRRGLPEEGASCPQHDSATAYRDGSVPARATCGDCDAPRCLDCLAVDDARCADCFALASKTLAQKMTAKGAILFSSIAAAVLVIIGLLTGSSRIVGGGGALLGGMMVKILIGQRRARKATDTLAQMPPDVRAQLQADAERLARALGGDDIEPLARVVERVDPPELGPYLSRALTTPAGTLFAEGSALPVTTTIAVGPTVRAQRQVDLVIRAGDEVVATFRASVLRPLQADDRIEFTVDIDERGSLSASAIDPNSGNELRVTHVDGDLRAPVAQAGAVQD